MVNDSLTPTEQCPLPQRNDYNSHSEPGIIDTMVNDSLTPTEKRPSPQ